MAGTEKNNDIIKTAVSTAIFFGLIFYGLAIADFQGWGTLLAENAQLATFAAALSIPAAAIFWAVNRKRKG